MSFDPNAIGNRIFTLRTNAKLSQEKLAEKLGVSHRHLGDLERGSSNGSVKILIDIAEYFHVSIFPKWSFTASDTPVLHTNSN